MVSRAISVLRTHATHVMAASIFAGLVLPQLAALLRPLLEPAIVALLTLPLLRLDWSAMGAYLRRPGLAVAAIGWQIVLAPMVLWTLGTVIDLPPALKVVLVLWGLTPPLLSAATFAQVLRLDAPLAVVVMVTATLLLPVTLPPMAAWLVDLRLVVAPWAFLARVALFFGVPFAVAATVRRLVPSTRLERAGPAIEAANVVLLAVFAVAVMDGVTHWMGRGPSLAAAFLGAAFLANIGFQALTAALFWSRGRRTAFSMGLCAGNRNMGLMLGLVGTYTGPEFQYFVAMSQLPVYLLPVFARLLYRRLW